MNAQTRTAHHTSALVLFSGGQDSTTCLAHALARYPRVETLGFDYGQRHMCWANENWTRRWDAAEHEVLIAQQYLPDDDINFIKSLVPIFGDPRYIRLEGRPFLIVYRPQHLPDPRKTASVWREYCRAAGVGEIHVCAALTHGNDDYRQFGFDSGVEFPPHNLRSGNINHKVGFFGKFQGNVMQYADIARSYLERDYPGGRIFRTVFPSWDNTARTGSRALVVHNGTPDNYEYWLSATIDRARRDDGAPPMVFINAWNEWAEGCHLEPDRRFGHGFLQATRHAHSGLRRFAGFSHTDLPHSDETPHKTFWKDIGDVLLYHTSLRIGWLKLAINRRPLLRGWLMRLIGLRRLLRTRKSAG